jgi:hypothetical protein
MSRIGLVAVPDRQFAERLGRLVLDAVDGLMTRNGAILFPDKTAISHSAAWAAAQLDGAAIVLRRAEISARSAGHLDA